MFEFPNNQFLLEKLGEPGHFSDPTLVVCAHVPVQQGPQTGRLALDQDLYRRCDDFF